MALRRGFKKEANGYAREFRDELGLQAHHPLCPWKLAELLDIPIISLSEFSADHPEKVRYLTKVDQKCLSAVTVFRGSRRLIVHNDSHHPLRQASNLAHELSHGILQHLPTAPFNEYGCRDYNKEIEEEANWLGPTLLISEEAALHIVQTKMSMPEATEYYGASKQVIQMRINVTGARRRIARQNERYSRSQY